MAMGDSPWFCHDLDCPEYTSLANITNDGQTVEIRKYEAQLWASTNVTDEELQDYIYSSLFI